MDLRGYAQLDDAGTVRNIAVFDGGPSPEYEEATGLKHVLLPEDIPVTAGDVYRDGAFYRDGVLLEPEQPEPEPEYTFEMP